MGTTDALMTLGIAIALGMLVGLQRERTGKGAHLGGVRTYPLVAVLGAASGMLVTPMGPWVVVAAFVGVIVTAVLGNVLLLKTEDAEIGVTSEVALLVVFVAGVMLSAGMREIAVAVGVGTGVLLHLKKPLHSLVDRMGDGDVRAVMQLALISFIVLPILPNETFGPFDVLNPHRIWLMVVLVVGMSLVGYVAFRLLGSERGALVAGLVGGMISSTATTVSYARMGKDSGAIRATICSVLLLATVVMYVRVGIEVWLVAPSHVVEMIVPLGVLAGVVGVCAGLSLIRAGREKGTMPEQENPAEMKSALVFGAMFAGVLLLVAAGKEWFGDSGMYVVAGLSGLANMDAITLSVSRMAERGRVEPDVAWRGIVIASVTNLVFKWVLIRWLGGAALARVVGPWFAVVAGSGVVLLLVW